MKKVFKRLGVVMMTLSMFTFSSCEELKELLKFDFDLEGEALYFDIDVISEIDGDVILGIETYDKTIAEILKEEAPDADINKIKAINLTSVTLEIVPAPNEEIEGADEENNFQNMKKIYAEVSAEGIDEGEGTIVAELSNVPNTYSEKLTIPVTGGSVNVKDYFNKNSFQYAIKAQLREPTTKPLRIKMTANYSFTFSL